MIYKKIQHLLTMIYWYRKRYIYIFDKSSHQYWLPGRC